DPLPDVVQVRAGEPPGPQPQLAQQPLGHPRRRGLAVGAGEVDDREGPLRVAEQLHDPADTVQRRLDRVLVGPGQDLLGHLGQAGLDLRVGRHGPTLLSMICTSRSPSSLAVVVYAVSLAGSGVPSPAAPNWTARVSPMMSRWCSWAACHTSSPPTTVRLIRSVTSRPASRRACWTARTRSRARPSR